MKKLAPLIIRLAEQGDLNSVIALYADDDLGGHADTVDEAALPLYQSAFDAIAASPNEMLFVAERDGLIVGTFQLAILTKVTGQGSRTLMVQSVQTRLEFRGQGIGQQMLEFAVEYAKSNHIDAVQLMSNARRSDAHRFYLRLGFEASHLGFRMQLK